MLSRGKKAFLFDITYFTATGKFYINEIVEWNVRYHTKTGHPYMYDAISKLEGLWKSGSQLPGLSTNWEDGYITISHEDGFPHLLIPERK